MGLDMYMEKLEVNDERDDIAYWRKNHELLKYINDHIHPYGDAEYGKDIELCLLELEKIIVFCKKQNEIEKYDYDSNYEKMCASYFDKKINPKIKVIFNAVW